eukprot:1118754-Prorocentrum_minimum.AAC.1
MPGGNNTSGSGSGSGSGSASGGGGGRASSAAATTRGADKGKGAQRKAAPLALTKETFTKVREEISGYVHGTWALRGEMESGTWEKQKKLLAGLLKKVRSRKSRRRYSS